MAKLTAAKALKVINASKATLYRDINGGKVSCEIDEKGRKVIDTSELIRVYGELKSCETNETVSQNGSMKPPETNETVSNFRQKIGFLESQLADAKDRIEELRQDREERREREEKLLGIVEKQTLMLEDKREKQGQSPPQQPIDKRIVYAIVGICGLSFSIPLVAWVVQSGFFAKLLN